MRLLLDITGRHAYFLRRAGDFYARIFARGVPRNFVHNRFLVGQLSRLNYSGHFVRHHDMVASGTAEGSGKILLLRVSVLHGSAGRSDLVHHALHYLARSDDGPNCGQYNIRNHDDLLRIFYHPRQHTCVLVKIVIYFITRESAND